MSLIFQVCKLKFHQIIYKGCQKQQFLNLRTFCSDSVFKMSDKSVNPNLAGEAGGSKTVDEERVEIIDSDGAFKTIGTQCGGDYVDEENIVVGKFCFSPQYESEMQDLKLEDQKIEELDKDDIFNKVGLKV